MKPSGPELLFVGNFLIIASISFAVIGLQPRLSGFLLLLQSVLEDYIFLEIGPLIITFFKMLL